MKCIFTQFLLLYSFWLFPKTNYPIFLFPKYPAYKLTLLFIAYN